MDKIKLVINSRVYGERNICIEQVEEVRSLKYLGATVSKDDSTLRTFVSGSQQRLVRLSRIWGNRNIKFFTTCRLYKSLVIRTLMYGCETWTMLTETERWVQAFEIECLRLLLRISRKEHKMKAMEVPAWWIHRNHCSPPSNDNNCLGSAMSLDTTQY